MTETKQTETKSIYARAADYIAEHGWTQGCMRRITGEVCIEGALSRVCSPIGRPSTRYYDDVSYVEAVDELEYLIGEQELTRWNDRIGRSVEDVYLLLKKADAL